MTSTDSISFDNLMSCTDCGEAKSPHLFPAGRKKCRQCRASDKRKNRQSETPEARQRRLRLARQYILNHKQGVANYKRQYYAERSDDMRRYSSDYYQRNAEKIKQQASDWKKGNPERRLRNNRKWSKENPDKVAQYNNRNRAKRRSCPIIAEQERVSSLIRTAIVKRGYRKDSKTCDILGCDWPSFRRHIELQFLSGMKWDNRSEWHIDHIVPMASAKSKEEALQLNHYTNLRPMWAEDNLSKGDKALYLI